MKKYLDIVMIIFLFIILLFGIVSKSVDIINPNTACIEVYNECNNCDSIYNVLDNYCIVRYDSINIDSCINGNIYINKKFIKEIK